MSFNIDKCKIMPLNVSKKDIEFTLNGSPLEIVDTYKYLGVVLSRTRLTDLFSAHISHVIREAESRVNCTRHFGF